MNGMDMLARAIGLTPEKLQETMQIAEKLSALLAEINERTKRTEAKVDAFISALQDRFPNEAQEAENAADDAAKPPSKFMQLDGGVDPVITIIQPFSSAPIGATNAVTEKPLAVNSGIIPNKEI